MAVEIEDYMDNWPTSPVSFDDELPTWSDFGDGVPAPREPEVNKMQWVVEKIKPIKPTLEPKVCEQKAEVESPQRSRSISFSESIEYVPTWFDSWGPEVPEQQPIPKAIGIESEPRSKQWSKPKMVKSVSWSEKTETIPDSFEGWFKPKPDLKKRVSWIEKTEYVPAPQWSKPKLPERVSWNDTWSVEGIPDQSPPWFVYDVPPKRVMFNDKVEYIPDWFPFWSVPDVPPMPGQQKLKTSCVHLVATIAPEPKSENPGWEQKTMENNIKLEILREKSKLISQVLKLKRVTKDIYFYKKLNRTPIRSTKNQLKLLDMQFKTDMKRLAGLRDELVYLENGAANLEELREHFKTSKEKVSREEERCRVKERRLVSEARSVNPYPVPAEHPHDGVPTKEVITTRPGHVMPNTYVWSKFQA